MNTDRITEPCPFCGEYERDIEIRPSRRGGYTAQCPTCGARSGNGTTPAEAIAGWNRRF